MTEVSYPAVAWQTQVNIRLIKPGQVYHQLFYSDSGSLLERGFGIFEGTCIFGEAYAEDADVIEAFLNSLNGRANHVELPIQRSTINRATTVKAKAAGVYTLAADPGNLKIGAYVRSGNRLLQIISVGTGPTISIAPDSVLGVGDPIAPAPSVRAASVRAVPLSRRSTSWGGPWTWAWIERLF